MHIYIYIYDGKHIDQEFSRVKNISREKALKKSAERYKDWIPFVWSGTPSCPMLMLSLERTLNFYILNREQRNFPQKSFMVSHKRSKNLKEILVPTRLPRIEETEKVTTMDVLNVQPKYVMYVRTTLKKQKDLQV